MGDPDEKPPAPQLPAYVQEPLERQPPERLEAIAAYAEELAAWKRATKQTETVERREQEEIGNEEQRSLDERGVSTDPADYEEVPDSGAYVTIKETKPGYRYYYWQWREGDSWKNEYIAPVERTDE